MTTRNMIEVAKSMENKVPVWYQLTVKDLQTLYKLDEWNAFTTAFYYGFALALRMVKRDAQKARAKARAGQEEQGRA